jgi:hypothetical protein
MKKGQDYVNQLEEIVRPNGRHYAPQYVEAKLKAIKSWADWNNKQITKKIKVTNTNQTPLN